MCTYPILMSTDKDFQYQLENQQIPTKEEVIPKLEEEMEFGYCQAIGELIYALTTCRPDISYPAIKLSQYATQPTHIHFDAVKEINQYLKATKDDGLHYWRKLPRTDLPFHPMPELKSDTNYTEDEIHKCKQIYTTLCLVQQTLTTLEIALIVNQSQELFYTLLVEQYCTKQNFRTHMH